MFQYTVLGAFILVNFLVGWSVVIVWFDYTPYNLLKLVESIILGTLISVTFTYALVLIFSTTDRPIFYGVIVWIIVGFATSLPIIRKYLGENRFVSGLTGKDCLLLSFILVSSSWLMFKSFRPGDGSTLLIGSNEIFDMGHAISIVRSFSWGKNIPFMSPFVSGTPLPYHFLFYFWVSIYAYFGVPIVWAMNIPSIIALSSLLVIVYYLPQIIFRPSRLMGWIAVLLTLTHGTLTFLYLALQRGIFLKDLWFLSKYPFAGPFDGSIISIFMTLNVFVNQRHLAMGMTIGLLAYLLIFEYSKKSGFNNKNVLILGALVGVMPYWHMTMYAISVMSGSIIFFVKRQFYRALLFFAATIAIGALTLIPFILDLFKANEQSVFVTSGIYASVLRTTLWEHIQYILSFWIHNFGFLLVSIIGGLFLLPRRARLVLVPFGVLFILIHIYYFVGPKDIDQKFLNFLIIGVNIISAYFFMTLWERKNIMVRICLAVIFLLSVLSGLIDLMVIKNDFAYPVLDAPDNKLIAWIRRDTLPNSVFLSYKEIFDPVVLGGRRNYFGYFLFNFKPDRSEVVASLYQMQQKQDLELFRQYGIDYMVIPKWEKNDFHFRIDQEFFRYFLPIAYEDDQHVVFGTTRSQ